VVKKIVYFSIVFLFLFSFLRGQEEEEKIPILEKKSIKEQYRETMEDLKIYREALLEYIMDNERAPKVENIEELLDHDIGNGLSFASFYLNDIPEEQLPFKDAWGNYYIYKYDKKQFWVASAGSEGESEGFKQEGSYINTDKALAGKDIIISNDGFVFSPMDEHLFHFFQFFLNISIQFDDETEVIK
jgi:hypothetical protein